MLIIKIDGLDLEPLERALNGLPDVFGTAVQGVPFAAVIGIGLPAELSGDDHLLAKRSEGFADKFLVQERAIDFGGIEEGDASIDRGMEKGSHLLGVFGWAIGMAHSHAAETDSGDFEIAVS